MASLLQCLYLYLHVWHYLVADSCRFTASQIYNLLWTNRFCKLDKYIFQFKDAKWMQYLHVWHFCCSTFAASQMWTQLAGVWNVSSGAVCKYYQNTGTPLHIVIQHQFLHIGHNCVAMSKVLLDLQSSIKVGQQLAYYYYAYYAMLTMPCIGHLFRRISLYTIFVEYYVILCIPLS